MSKKILGIFLVALALTACGTDKTVKVTQAESKSEIVKEEKIEVKKIEEVIEKKVVIKNLKIEKITEDGARISFVTDIPVISEINGLKIDVIPATEHFYYLTGLDSGKEQSITIKAGTVEEKAEFVTKDKATIDYTKTPDYLEKSVFYEIFVRAFADSNGDGQGDFNGITENMDYLKNLGIDGIWLMPINSSPSYHGYDVVDYYSLNSSYGTIEDFKKLIEEAHKKDIKVIMDLVLNHNGSDHKYFNNAKKGEGSPYRDWYVWKDEPEGGGWYENEDGKYYYSAFWGGMPDLNYRNPLVVSEAKNKTIVLGCLYSGLLFGLAHLENLIWGEDMNPVTIWSTIIFGCIIGFVWSVIYLRTKSLWSVILLHFAWDFSEYCNYMMAIERYRYSGSYNFLVRQIPIIIIMLIVAIVILHRNNSNKLLELYEENNL